MVGLNNTCVIVGSVTPQLIREPQVQVLESRLVDLLEEQVGKAQATLYALAKPLCAKANETALLPLWAIHKSYNSTH